MGTQNDRKAANIADEGMKAAIDAIKEGKTEQEISVEPDLAMRTAGAEKTQSPVSSGLNTNVPVRFPSSKVILRGDLILMDLAPIYHGYFSDIT